MYIRPEVRRRRSPVWRIALLTILIVSAAGLLRLVAEQPVQERPFYPTPTPTLPAEYFLTQGDIDLAEGRLRDAIAAYAQAISLEPENVRPYIQQTRALIYTRDTVGALENAEQAVLLSPNNPQALAAYCWALDWEGQYTAALNACECAIELEPDDATAHAFMAEVFADRGDWIPARTTAQEAVALDYQNPDAHHNLGYALEMQGRYAEAMDYYKNALVLRPNLAPYHISAGQNSYWLGQFEQATEYFAEAIKLDPLNPVGYDQLGWTYHTQGEYLRAVDALQQALQIDPTYARAWGRLGTIYYLRQNYEQSSTLLPTAIELSEREFLLRLRNLELLMEVEGLTGLESIPIMQGRFHMVDTNTLEADIRPIAYTSPELMLGEGGSCGDVVARSIRSRTIRVNPNTDLDFSQTFSQAVGTARVDLNTAELTLELRNVPRPAQTPYEVQVRFKPNRQEALGFVQPDGRGGIDDAFGLPRQSQAPLEYYYQLGLSYAYMEPPMCEQAVPWLLQAVNIDSAYYNPAWQGLRICPSADSPPTPLPTFTPTPDPAASN